MYDCRDDFGLSIFLLAFFISIVGVLCYWLLFYDSLFVFWSLIFFFILSLGAGLIASKPRVKSWRVVIFTVDGSVFYVGRNLSWANAKILRDGAVKKFESDDVMLSIMCVNDNGRFGVRDFNKKNIVHIGWLED